MSSFGREPIMRSILLSIALILQELPATAADCAGKTVAQCADALAKTVESLRNENLKLNSRIVTLENKVDDLGTALNELKVATGQRLELIDRKIVAINQALSFGFDRVTRKGGITFNGRDGDLPETPRCPSGSLMVGLRISGYDHTKGDVDCVVLKPAEVR